MINNKSEKKKIMVGHWVGNVFVMCWSGNSKAHETTKCVEKRGGLLSPSSNGGFGQLELDEIS